MLSEFKYVVDNSEYVKIDITRLDSFIEELGEVNYAHWSKELDLDLHEKEWILLACIIESMNFCFWQKPKWKIKYKDDVVSGSNALFYSIIKQVEDNKEFLNMDYLNNLDKDTFYKIFDGVEGNCPLLEERYNNFKEIINYISSNDFYNEIYSINKDIDLLKYIPNTFKNFDDKSEYKGEVIHFNKRATLLVNDLYYLSQTVRNNLGNVNNLSGCADYGIPRTLRDYGILVYNDELSNLVDNEIEIKHDSDMEIEIRANMLYVIELIKEKLKEKNIFVNSVELDNLIWWMGKKSKNNGIAHHTITIYY